MNEIEVHQVAPLTTTEPSIGGMMQLALDKGVAPDTIKALCDAYVQMEDRKNAREFSNAMSEFQRTCPPVPKNRQRVVTRGISVPYADLPSIQRHIGPHLNAVGLSYSFSQSEDKGRVTAVCHVRHDNGHTVSYPYTAVAGSASGATPDVLTSMATTTAMRRALTLAFSFVIDDAENIEAPPEATIDADQTAALTSALDAKRIPHERFLGALGYKTFAEIPASKFAEYAAMIEKRKATA